MTTTILTLSPAERAYAARHWPQTASADEECRCGHACRHNEPCEACGAPLIHFRRVPAVVGTASLTGWVNDYLCDACESVVGEHVEMPGVPWGTCLDGRTVTIYPGLFIPGISSYTLTDTDKRVGHDLDSLDQDDAPVEFWPVAIGGRP